MYVPPPLIRTVLKEYDKEAFLLDLCRKARTRSAETRQLRDQWKADLSLVPLLSPGAIAQSLGPAETNFPDVFRFDGDLLMATGTVELIAAVLPFSYFRKGGYNAVYFSGMDIPSSLVTVHSQIMKASMMYSDDVRTALRVEILPMEVETLLVARTNVDFFISRGRGPHPVMIDEDDKTYQVSLGRSDEEVEVSPGLLAQIKEIFKAPTWVERDVTDIRTYETNAYDSVYESHRAFAKYIIDTVPREVHLIVPGDGPGLFAALSDRPGTFGDLVTTERTHYRVRRETAEETIARGRIEGEGKPLLLINAYTSLFFSTPPPDIPSIWIDHPLILDREIPGLERISEALYVCGVTTDLKVALDRYGRRRWKPYHVPYTQELRKQRRLRIARMSQVAQEAFRSIQGLHAFVPASLGDYSAASGAITTVEEEASDLSVPLLVTSFSEMIGSGSCYVSFLGRVLDIDDARRHTARKPILYSRTIYWVPEESSNLVPTGAIMERIWDQIYFAIPDAEATKAYVEYRRGRDFQRSEYEVRPFQEDTGWGCDEKVWDTLHPGSTEQDLEKAFAAQGVPYSPAVVEYYRRRGLPLTGIKWT